MRVRVFREECDGCFFFGDSNNVADYVVVVMDLFLENTHPSVHQKIGYTAKKLDYQATKRDGCSHKGPKLRLNIKLAFSSAARLFAVVVVVVIVVVVNS